MRRHGYHSASRLTRRDWGAGLTAEGRGLAEEIKAAIARAKARLRHLERLHLALYSGAPPSEVGVKLQQQEPDST